MPDTFLGPLFANLGFHEGPEGSHDAKLEMAATSAGGVQEEAGKTAHKG